MKESLKEVGFGADAPGIQWKPNLLGDVGVSLMATYAGRAADMKPWLENAQINTDRNLRLQYLAGLAANSYVQGQVLEDILKYFKFPEDMFTGSPDRLYEMKVGMLAARKHD